MTAPATGRTADENEMKAEIVAALNAAFRCFSFPGGRWSTGYGAEMAADALIAGPLAPVLQEAATARKERDEALERGRVLYEDRTAECETASRYWREARKMHNDLIALARMYGEACGLLAKVRMERHAVDRRIRMQQFALREANSYTDKGIGSRAYVRLYQYAQKMSRRTHAAEAEAAQLRSRLLKAEQGGEAMQTELRPFAKGDGEGLDEVVILGSHIVHAETMSDTALWIGIHDQAGGLVHIWVNAVRRKGRLGIVMTATDEDERGTIGQGTAKAAPLPDSDKGGKGA